MSTMGVATSGTPCHAHINYKALDLQFARRSCRVFLLWLSRYQHDWRTTLRYQMVAREIL